jgi:hypothetical protein
VIGEVFKIIQRAMARKGTEATFHDSESTDESNRKVNALRILAALSVNGTTIVVNLESSGSSKILELTICCVSNCFQLLHEFDISSLSPKLFHFAATGSFSFSAILLRSRLFAIPGSEYLSNKFYDSSTVKRTIILGPQYFVGCVMMVEDESLT